MNVANLELSAKFHNNPFVRESSVTLKTIVIEHPETDQEFEFEATTAVVRNVLNRSFIVDHRPKNEKALINKVKLISSLTPTANVIYQHIRYNIKYLCGIIYLHPNDIVELYDVPISSTYKGFKQLIELDIIRKYETRRKHIYWFNVVEHSIYGNLLDYIIKKQNETL